MTGLSPEAAALERQRVLDDHVPLSSFGDLFECACHWEPLPGELDAWAAHRSHVNEQLIDEGVAPNRPEFATIRTRSQLDALPVQSVIQSDRAATGDGNPWTWERFDEGWFTTAFDPEGVPDLPALLLWHPDWSDQ